MKRLSESAQNRPGAVAVITLLLGCLARVHTRGDEWVAVYDYDGARPSVDSVTTMAVDSSGGVLVGGYSGVFRAAPEWVVVKYGDTGRQLWVDRYSPRRDGSGQGALVIAMVVDRRGYVYATGSADPVVGSGSDCTTIKYAPDGVVEWSAAYDDGGRRRAYGAAIAADEEGNVYVTGQAGAALDGDWLTIKYDSEGKERWAERFGEPGEEDNSTLIGLDCDGNVYVSGWVDQVTGFALDASQDLVTVKYDGSGQLLWAEKYDAGRDRPHDMTVVDGRCSLGFPGTTVAPGADGGPAGEAVYLTGESGAWMLEDYVTMKYDGDGNRLWVRHYEGPAGGRDIASALAVDRAGNVYVTGKSEALGTGRDCCTIKYGPDGEELWVARYDGPDHLDDVGTDIAVDGAGRVFVTGGSESVRTGSDYLMLVYDARVGRQEWMGRFHRRASESAYAIALDDDGSFYVTGNSGSVEVDIVTIKNTPFRRPRPFIRGDCNGDLRVRGQVSDAAFLLNHLFRDGEDPGCLSACDMNGDGKLDLSDAVYLLKFNFEAGPPPPAPFPECGLPPEEVLECVRSPCP